MTTITSKNPHVNIGLIGGNTAIVVASDAPAAIIAAANALKSTMGDLIQVCDGTADDVQIQAAVDAMDGGILQIIGYTFTFSSAVVLKTDITIRGEGSGVTTVYIVPGGSNDAFTTIGGATACNNMTIEDMTINGNRSHATPTTGGYAVNILATTNANGNIGIILDNVTISYCYDGGALLDDCQDASILNCVFYNNGNSTSEYGLKFQGTNLSSLYQNFITNSRFKNNTGDGLIISGLAEANAITGCNFTFNNRGAYLVYWSQSGISNCIFDSNTTDGLWIDTSTTGLNDITGCRFIHNSKGNYNQNAELRISASRHLTIGNNEFNSNNCQYSIYAYDSGGTTCGDFVISDNDISGLGITDTIYHDLATYGRKIINNNLPSIEPGEIRTFSGSITAGAAGTYTSIDNDYGQDVGLLELIIRITTQDGDAPNIDADLNAANNSVAGVSLFDDLPGETAGFYSSIQSASGQQTVPQLWESGGGNRYLNMAILDNDGSQLVAKYYGRVMGL